MTYERKKTTWQGSKVTGAELNPVEAEPEEIEIPVDRSPFSGLLIIPETGSWDNLEIDEDFAASLLKAMFEPIIVGPEDKPALTASGGFYLGCCNFQAPKQEEDDSE